MALALTSMHIEKDLTTVFVKKLVTDETKLLSEEFVRLCYDNILKRQALKEEVESWCDALLNGMSRNEVITEFVKSEEFSAKSK